MRRKSLSSYYKSTYGYILSSLIVICVLFFSNSLTQAQNFEEHGNTIIANHKTLQVQWRKWQENNITHIGISDPGLEKVLGVESLDNSVYELQPVRWFSSVKELPVSFNYPYRYLDVTELIQDAGIESKVVGDSLVLNIPLEKFIQVKEVNPKTIKWQPGLTLHQDYIDFAPDKVFPVTYLEIDLKTASLIVKPLLNSSQGLVGIASVASMAQSQEAVAAINGGFFNRKTHQPLGALKRDNIWLSSPILDRGVIAWDREGNFKLGHLSWQETLSTKQGVSLPIVSLNSGYIQLGLSRYTPEWGLTYTPMTGKETVFVVENGEIRDQIVTNVDKTPIVIPKDGYLLIQRGQSSLSLEKNLPVQLTSQSTPEVLGDYPYILGAGPLLMQEGKIVLDVDKEGFKKAFQKQNASRSGIATTSKGTILLVALHNRIEGTGASLMEFAELMQRLGAIDALNLDGGSSSSLYLGGQVIDKPPALAVRVNNGLGLFRR